MSEPKRMKTSNKNQSQEGLASTSTGGERYILDPEIMPPEMWERVFNYMESPKDLLSCWYTTPVWAKALRTTDSYFKMTLPFLRPHLEVRDLLKCSSVSKSWNAIVHSCVHPAENFDSSVTPNSTKQLGISLDSPSMIDYINYLELPTNDELGENISKAINPVVFRCVEIKVSLQLKIQLQQQSEAERKMSTFTFNRRNLLTCLNHHGHFIRNLHLTIQHLPATPITIFDKVNLIKCCLRRTPNLRILQISSADYSIGDEEDEVNNSADSWPSLKHLKVLLFSNCTAREEFTSLANAYAHQLVEFQFGFRLSESHFSLANNFCCLKKIVYFLYQTGNMMEFAGFIRAIKCPLKHLTVMICDPVHITDKTYSGLTKAGNAVSSTLETLVFNPWARFDENYDTKKLKDLRLPKLKSLVLSSFSFPSIEWLKSTCPGVEQLTLKQSKRDSRGDPNDFYSDLYSGHQFWSELPYIQSANVSCMYYNRDFSPVGVERANSSIVQCHQELVQKFYSRSVYEALYENEDDTGSDTQDNCGQTGNEDAPKVLITRSKKAYKRD